jgi:hypothetical protein
VRQGAAKRLNRQLAYEAIARSILPILLGLLLVAAMVFWVTNVQVSQKIVEGRFVRWTVGQADKGQSMPRVFIDLPDGKAVMAVAWADWRPPPPGSLIRVEEQSLRRYGKRYRLVR